MFKNYKLHSAKFHEYLKTTDALRNFSDNNEGVVCVESLFAIIYDSDIKNEYSARYSNKQEKLIFCKFTNDEQKASKDEKYQTLVDTNKKEYSFTDTCDKIKNFVLFNECAYIFTDYGLIQISQFNYVKSHVTRISNIRFYFNDDTSHKQELEDYINDNIVEFESPNTQRNISICTQGNYGIRTTELEIKPFDCDIKKNYNDDLPYEKLNELVNSDEEELILLHGEPGTGKTSIIKKLIYDNEDTEFIYFDFKLLNQSFSDTRIFDFLTDNRNNVFIIEDCEKLFTDRNSGNNYLNAMLNLTDGIIGEAFAIKFICTFNCPLSKIDKAVLREGRLSLIYEFRKLSLEKTRAFDPNATEPKTLAAIYNTEDNGHKKNESKIGF